MKKVFFVLSIITSVFSLQADAQTKKEIIPVWGNCGMCKVRIETAAKSAGAKKASWNPDTHELSVTYKESKTDATKIQTSIAEAGYDTRDMTAPDQAYNSLHGCCKYERKKATAPVKID